MLAQGWAARMHYSVGSARTQDAAADATHLGGEGSACCAFIGPRRVSEIRFSRALATNYCRYLWFSLLSAAVAGEAIGAEHCVCIMPCVSPERRFVCPGDCGSVFFFFASWILVSDISARLTTPDCFYWKFKLLCPSVLITYITNL